MAVLLRPGLDLHRRQGSQAILPSRRRHLHLLMDLIHSLQEYFSFYPPSVMLSTTKRPTTPGKHTLAFLFDILDRSQRRTLVDSMVVNLTVAYRALLIALDKDQ